MIEEEFRDSNDRVRMSIIQRNPGRFMLQEISDGEYRVRLSCVVNSDYPDEDMIEIDSEISDFYLTDAEVMELQLRGVEIIE
jgi:hypothetical protein